MTDHPTTDHPDRSTANRPTVGGRVADWLGGAFYVTVAAVALAGQTDAAVGWLHWPIATALPAVAALELGGIALAARADFRRRLGERAVAARALSAAVACFAVGFNWLGHTNHLAGGFFAGMSALGYCVWLIQAGDRRRDQLRAAGMLTDVPPSYPAALWLRHPWLTHRARTLAAANPQLGVHGSLTAAVTALRVERRQRAVAKILHRQIRASADPHTAEIAVTVFDLDEIAARLADRANYDGLTDLIAVGLDPDRLLRPKPTDEPTGAVEPQATNRPTNRSTKVAATNRRSVAPKPTDRPEPSTTTNQPRLTLVGRPAAVVNAATLRKIYGPDLPTVERQIRTRTGWSKERVANAVQAYLAGADLDANDDDEEQAV